MFDLAQLPFISEIKIARLWLVANDASAVRVCTAVCVLEAFLAEEAPTVGHKVACVLVADIALELPHS